jgi:phosphoenolpyruvate-protein phosphotransferase
LIERPEIRTFSPMAHNSFAATLSKLSERAAFFENADKRDRYLIDAITSIKEEIGVSMAGIFLYEPDSRELVFRAGLDDEGLWDRIRCDAESEPIRFSLDDSHVGRAFHDGRNVRLEYDESHPFRSKLIVPIAHGPIHIGVLILADGRSAAFSALRDNELMSLAARLGDILEDASALVRDTSSAASPVGHTLTGTRASEGVAHGFALPFWSGAAAVRASHDVGTPDEELARFDRALEVSLQQLDTLTDNEASPISDVGALIFQAHVLMLRDPEFAGRMRRKIENGTSAPDAITEVAEEYAARFAAMTEQRFAEKAQDVRDLGNRLLVNLDEDADSGFGYEGRIVLARHVYPSDLARLAAERVSGVVLIGSGVTAHISILARSLGIPVLITHDNALLAIAPDTELLLDVDGERLHIAPPADLVATVMKRAEGEGAPAGYYTIKGRTADDRSIAVYANINILKDAEDARRQGAEGIGLYRSEFPFILKDDYLSEEQQYRIYRSIVETQRGKPVDLRTADIGGDKLMQGRSTPEENPFLGVRGIRFSLANREMFRDQLRAMLRAGADTDLGIMLPMVSGVEEVIEARAEIEDAIVHLESRGVPHNGAPRIGAMVELPSAALAIEDLAAETDFLSIGTNDLTMYLLAVDRTNEGLGHLYRSYHPMVLRAINSIVEGAGEKAASISVCGDSAADPMLAIFYVGIGICALSVSPSKIEPTKQLLSRYTFEEARTIAHDLLDIGRISEMERYVDRFQREFRR